MGKHGPPVERFWRNVDREGDCWTWQLSRSTSGYGQFSLSPGTRLAAHRFVWELLYGPIPNGLLVLHRCDNRPCVRPSHLFLGTAEDNYRDMRSKGRASMPPRLVGPVTTTSALNPALAALIRQSDAPAHVWASALGVAASTVRKVRKGETWRNR